MDAADDGNTHAEDTPSDAQEAQLVILHSNRSDQPLDHVTDLEIIDDDGDVLVQTSSKEMLVSSKILALASPVFKAMYNSNINESRATPFEAYRSPSNSHCQMTIRMLWQYFFTPYITHRNGHSPASELICSSRLPSWPININVQPRYAVKVEVGWVR